MATLTGTLSLATYPELRDSVLKIAAEAPESVIADIQGLEIDDDTLMTVFSVIAARIGEWPGVPFAVVTDRADHVARLSAQLVDRFVAVHATSPRPSGRVTGHPAGGRCSSWPRHRRPQRSPGRSSAGSARSGTCRNTSRTL
ncbi:hypothetical protein [Amycolatopsis australiensis]|uniref:hypothetical protein n=1 Tax=Amycolatopsis australiensis TaxID=546364 RepID=UPI00318453CC